MLELCGAFWFANSKSSVSWKRALFVRQHSWETKVQSTTHTPDTPASQMAEIAAISAAVRLNLARDRSSTAYASLSPGLTATGQPFCTTHLRATWAVETLWAAAMVLSLGLLRSTLRKAE